MGGLFGGGPKGPSLAEKTRDYYQKVSEQRSQAQASVNYGQAAISAAAAPTPTIQSTDPEKLKVAGGGFFGQPSTFLGGSGSRSTFLGG